MSRIPRINNINQIGFRQLLVITFSIGIILLALISAWVTSSLSGRSVAERIQQEGLSLTSTFAERSRVALLYKSEEDARLVIEDITAFPDVSSAAVFDEENNLLSGSGNYQQWLGEKIEIPDSGSDGLTIMEGENEDFLTFVAVIFTGTQQGATSFFLSDLTEEDGSEFIGYTRLEISKAGLYQMQTQIRSYNIMVSAALAVVLLGILMIITGWITKPLSNLSSVMGRAQAGEKQVRAKIEGTREITKMEEAFNSMMNVLEARERDLLATRDLALEAARVKGEFAANVSHELRTPLNGVLGMLELLKDMGLARKQLEYVDIASSSAESLLSLIDDILDFSKIDSGKMSLDEVDFDLISLMEETIVLLGSQAQRKGIDLAYVVNTGIPSLMRGDDKRIRQILLNLAGNALKFTEAGEVGISVSELSSSGDRIELKFEVTDTGIGLSEDVKEKIFDAFSQADGSTTRKYGGTGLGLAISRQLVQLMGGTIGVDSEKGRGSSFWFSVELKKLDPSVGNEGIIFDPKLRVVIIEDSPAVSASLQSSLDGLGVECTVFGSAILALEFLRVSGQKNTIILIDEFMEDMNASDFRHLIIQDPALAGLKIVALVNRAQTMQENSIASSSMRRLTKPVRLQSLKELLTLLSSSYVQEAKTNNHLAPDASVVSFEGAYVLIVEDNRANQLVAAGMLERLNCRFQIADNGIDALQLVSRENFDLVLMDCHMPEMDGYEATARIRQLESDTSKITIIAMTANVLKGERDKCLAVGMNGYLPKPLKMEGLKKTLTQWLAPTIIPVSARASDSDAVSNIIDPEVFNELSRQIGDALPAMVQVFIEDSPRYIRSLKDTVTVRDYSSAADIAHTIKGSASNFGAYRLFEVCAKMETYGRNHQSGQMVSLLPSVITECNFLIDALKQQFDREEFSECTDDTDDQKGNILEIEELQQRILIVDDDRGMRFAMRKILEDEGYSVEEVSNGEQALMFCERMMPDLILMDAIMPEMDGFRACAEIQKMPGGKHVPVLIVTALNDEVSIGRAFESGATDYIPKPVNFAVLRKRIRRLVQASHSEKFVHKLAYHDPLTGLPNRSQFSKQLAEIIRQSGPNDMSAVLFLDLDRFKLVNDTYGHDAGDLLLRVVAERLLGCVRKGDIVSRFGGDEFTILLRWVNHHDAINSIAEKIHTTLCRPFVFLGKKMHVNCSIGISTTRSDNTDIPTLLKNADIAMYRAKNRGASYEFYDHTMEDDASRRLELESELQGAIERGEIKVFYQPQEDLETGKVIGMEALIRWEHPQKGMVSPMEFIPLAEETGQIVELGVWVLKTACIQLKTWMDQTQCNLRVAVNLSGRQLDNSSVVKHVSKILEETGLPPQNLELEITESAIMENAESVISILEDLRAQEISLAVDDFGTGYSSLSYLRKFPIHMLKVDRSFVSDISINKTDADIVSTIITLAHKMGLKVIAEGVETSEQKAFLKKEGCDYIQGYLLGKPVPADEFEALYLAEIIDNRV